jgi:1,4-alpha-glucan branching enzyme
MGRWTSWRSAVPQPDRPVGDLAIVLHSHMPYVEGFGTYPFGEEWLFDAVARSHLPVLEAAHSLTLTVTPVLADQLEAPGVGERMLAFLREHRLGAAERDAESVEPALRPAAEADVRAYSRSIELLEELDGSGLEAFRRAGSRVELVPSAATHAVLPKLATEAGRRLQVDTGLRSHRRRFGRPSGFWLPECAYVPGLEGVLAERGLDWTCLDLSATEADDAALVPVRLPGGVTGFTIDWPSVALVWSDSGYPSDPAYLEYHRLSQNGMRLWSIGGDPYDPEMGAARADEHARGFLRSVAGRLEGHAERAGRPGLCVFAIDTELLGHWWSEGPQWLERVLAQAGAEGLRLVTLTQAQAEHEPEDRAAAESSWGEGKGLETWDSPRVSDLLWAARRLELRVVGAARSRTVAAGRMERAARELLAVQSSDWAFMDHRAQAGDYPYTRVTGHAQAAAEALGEPEPPEPAMRHLAPDLSLTPLTEP